MLLRPDLLQRISSDLAMLPSHLELIIKTAPLRYKVFEIPKKSGGYRQVAQPAREVKAIQRWVVREFGSKLPVHSCAMAYRAGSSIQKNAEAHVSSRFVLKLDFTNFFPSIQYNDVCLHFERHLAGLADSPSLKLLARVCCWAPLRNPPLKLCIGAPSSPLISNSVMYDFDRRVAEIANRDGVVYTRYADDITLSVRERGMIDRYEEIVKGILSEIQYPKLTLNAGKTVRASRAGRRVVTGLVLTPDGHVSIGRERKRLIRSMYHHSLTQEFSEDKAQLLAGLLAFADSVEPGFSKKLKNSVRP